MILVHIILFPFLWPLYLVYFTVKAVGDILFPDDRMEHANEQAEKRLRSMGTTRRKSAPSASSNRGDTTMTNFNDTALWWFSKIGTVVLLVAIVLFLVSWTTSKTARLCISDPAWCERVAK